MSRGSHFLLTAAALCALLACGKQEESAQTESPGKEIAQDQFKVDVHYHKLDNGLKVVISPDSTAPIVALGVYFNIGFRNEPKDRTGFAHLFEHMMFQGSENLGKMEFVTLVQASGGILNGTTRFDFTNYFEVFPSHKLETILWAEADRMRGLAITQDNLTNQQGVVKNEVKVNVLNAPYGGFPWLDMPQYANTNWYNAHNFYGDLTDLDAANLEDVQTFFDKFYAPNNAAIAIVGDVDKDEALALVKKYFGDLKPSEIPPPPDLTEPRQEEQKRFTKEDNYAKQPALAFAYHMPDRNTPEYYAMGLIDQILLQGDDSSLSQILVKREGITSGVSGGINMLGNMFNYNGPMLWMGSLIHDEQHTEEKITTLIDEAVEKLRNEPVSQEALDTALVKFRSGFYDSLTGFGGFGLADLLASFALFDDDPERVNRIEDELRAITPELIQKTAREYLRPTNRTILVIDAKG